ncbi:MAG TPA: MFS transporter [Phenylobacterium sp.]|uniref:MFS transporter n=1 Tax=Phenylobacterium sp. TaxID=1871053 RepID=UPI002F926802
MSTALGSDGAVALAQRTRLEGGAQLLVATSLASSLAFASGSLAAVSLAAIGQDLALTPLELQWLVNAELLPLAAFTLTAGGLGDRFGRRPVFILGIALFGAGALLSALAGAWAALLLGRLVCGLGEALILPNALSMLGEAFPSDRKARAVGVWSAAGAVAGAAAPGLAGLVLEHGSWRTPFLILAAVAVLALFVAVLWTPRGGARSAVQVDWPGAGLSVLGLGALGWGLTSLTGGAASGALSMTAIMFALLVLGALVVVERRQGRRAMLPPWLLASRDVIGANLFTALLYGPFTAMLTLLPFVMIQGAMLSPVVAGAAFIPLQILITVISPMAGRICQGLGRRAPLILGGLMVGAGCLAALRIDADAAYWPDIFPAVLLLALGMGLVVAPLSTLVLTSVDTDHAGTAAGVNSSVARVGSLVAVALIGGVLQGGPGLIPAFHLAMAVAAGSCGLAALAVLIVEPGPHTDFIPRD